ncbi:hypothetical protein ODS27_14880, partial [Escherichia coli]|nr:hypothetical protein [Escherichia coli]
MASNIGRCPTMPEKGEKNCWSLRFTGELKNASGRAGALTTGALLVAASGADRAAASPLQY